MPKIRYRLRHFLLGIAILCLVGSVFARFSYVNRIHCASAKKLVDRGYYVEYGYSVTGRYPVGLASYDYTKSSWPVRVSDDDLDVIRGLHTLEKLAIVGALGEPQRCFDDSNTGLLRMHTKLDYLDLSYTNVTAKQLQEVARTGSLRVLKLNGVSVDKETVGVLVKLTQLSQLDLIDSQLEQEDISAIRQALQGCKVSAN